MFEFLFYLPMDLQFYVLFMSALLPLSLLVVHQYIDRSDNLYYLVKTRSTYNIYTTNSLLNHTDLPINTIIIFIKKCIKLKDSPNGDNDDHHLLLTP
ncbi:hypothetical protein [Virgibacillus sp. DJP39]|uniref:hypothetical protein n=1 Tax=Virgibacillus sp. DJP39 TaxID=3409790 RepID=UPI003BB7F946